MTPVRSALASTCGLVAMVAACNALVESPDAFKLRVGVDSGGADASASPGPDARAPWPMLGANAAHTSQVDIEGSTLAGKKANALRITGRPPPSAGPAVDGEGTAYFVTTAGELIAFTASGETWSRDLGGAARCTPALANDGAIYATAKGVGLVAYPRDGGAALWTAPVGGGSHPVIAPNGTVYVVDAAGVHAVSPTGEVKWTYPLGAPSSIAHDEAVAIDDQGYVYAVRDGLHAINPDDGRRAWHVAEGDAQSPPPVIASGNVYVGSGTSLVAVEIATKKKRWSNVLGGGALRASPAIDKNGILYVVQGNVLSTLHPESGDFNLPEPEIGLKRPFTPAIDGRGFAYAASAADVELGVIAVFSLGVERDELRTLPEGQEPLGFAIGSNGNVYYTTSSVSGSSNGELTVVAK